MKKVNPIIGAFFLILTLGFSGIWTAEAADFSGNWQGTWTSFYGDAGNLSVATANSGASICGKINVYNTECGNFNNLSLSGTASGDYAEFECVAICPLDGSRNELEFTDGYLSGNSMNGYYTIYSDGEFWDYGTFRLTRRVPTMSGNPGARYRVYNPNDGQHHYTTNPNEYCVLGSLGWMQEGIGSYIYSGIYQIGTIQTVPYYRLYNPNNGDHHWTINANEYNGLGTIGWTKEGVDGYVFASQVTGSQALYRLYNPNAITGTHHWTMDANERGVLIGSGWRDEGVACYVSP